MHINLTINNTFTSKFISTNVYRLIDTVIEYKLMGLAHINIEKRTK